MPARRILTGLITACAMVVPVFFLVPAPSAQVLHNARLPAMAGFLPSSRGIAPVAPLSPTDQELLPRMHLLASTLPPAGYRVRTGDTLSLIARREYGSASLWPALWWVNRARVHDPAVLLVGSPLTLSPWHPQAAWLLSRAEAAIPAPPKPRPASTPAGPAAPAPVVAAASGGSLQAYAQQIFGSQYSCAASIINMESGWNVYATNPVSGAYGIPQALPGSKMASAGADWATNGDTQLRWMLGYVDSVYGGACAAWAHEQAAGSY